MEPAVALAVEVSEAPAPVVVGQPLPAELETVAHMADVDPAVLAPEAVGQVAEVSEAHTPVVALVVDLKGDF